MFDTVDRLYGDFQAALNGGAGAEGGEGGAEGGAIEAAAGAEEPIAESIKKVEKLLTERKIQLNNAQKQKNKIYQNRFVDVLVETIKPDNTKKVEQIKIYDKNLKINKEIDNIIDDIDKMLEE